MSETNGAVLEQSPGVAPLATQLPTQPRRASTFGTAFVDAIRPQTFEQAMYLCKVLAGSDFAPKDYKGKPGNVLIAITEGAQLGLSPAQSLQGIAVINGRPTVWGDHALALVQAHPSFVDCKEWFEGEGEKRVAYCTLMRKGRTPVTRSFSYAQAKKARLIGKDGPWSTYEERMHQMRARSWALRDGASDILRGIAITEEALDAPVEPVPPTLPTASGKLAARAQALHAPVATDESPQDLYTSTLGAMLDEQNATVAAEQTADVQRGAAAAEAADGEDPAAEADPSDGVATATEDASAADPAEPALQRPAWRSAAQRGVKAASVPWTRSVITLGEEKGYGTPEALLGFIQEIVHPDVASIGDLSEDEIKAVHGALLRFSKGKKRS